VHVHARNLARGKHYRYTLRTDAVDDPLAWTVPDSLDLGRMRETADRMRGRHDFGSFRFKCRSPNTVKTLARVDIGQTDTGWVIDIEGDAFLRKMVRKLVASLVQVGMGELDVEAVSALLDADPPRRSPDAAPAHGLCLVRVLRG
jgi:tRNA pseudouridine38-40 synthase